MSNIIEIIEQNNRLDFVSTYTPIVCGNSNYVLKFTLSSAWQNANKKAAVFVVDGKRQVVDFDGNECKVPILPNAEFVFVSLVSGNGDNQLITTPIRIRLERNILGGDLSEFDQTASYLSKVLGAINSIENGKISVESSKTANNVSNPNLLINGDFRVNQRGKTTYSVSGYSVDRWQIGGNSSLSVEENGITFVSNGITSFGQRLEGGFSLFAGKPLSLSAKMNGVVYTVSGSVPENKPTATTGETTILNLRIVENGIQGYLKFVWINSSACYRVYFYCSSEQTLKIEYFKLEVGETPTTFVPRLYAEELALCQRYYRIFKQVDKTLYCPIGVLQAGNTGVAYGLLNLGSAMRTPPSLAYSKMEDLQFSAGTQVGSLFKTFGTYTYSNPTNTFVVFLTGTFVAGQMYLLSVINGGYLELDAEIY